MDITADVSILKEAAYVYEVHPALPSVTDNAGANKSQGNQICNLKLHIPECQNDQYAPEASLGLSEEQKKPALSGISPGLQPCSLSFEPGQVSCGSCGRDTTTLPVWWQCLKDFLHVTFPVTFGNRGFVPCCGWLKYWFYQCIQDKEYISCLYYHTWLAYPHPTLSICSHCHLVVFMQRYSHAKWNFLRSFFTLFVSPQRKNTESKQKLIETDQLAGTNTNPQNRNMLKCSAACHGFFAHTRFFVFHFHCFLRKRSCDNKNNPKTKAPNSWFHVFSDGKNSRVLISSCKLSSDLFSELHE